MKHCCVEDPADLCSINIAGQGIVESRPEDFQLFDNVAYINAADNQLNLGKQCLMTCQYPCIIVKRIELPSLFRYWGKDREVYFAPWSTFWSELTFTLYEKYPFVGSDIKKVVIHIDKFEMSYQYCTIFIALVIVFLFFNYFRKLQQIQHPAGA